MDYTGELRDEFKVQLPDSILHLNGKPNTSYTLQQQYFNILSK